MKYLSILFILTFLVGTNKNPQNQLPEGFVYVKELIPDIALDIRYAGSHNFVGKPIRGYKQPRAILSKPAADALHEIQQELENVGYCLKIFDAYRPQRAVNHFMEWAKIENDTLMKREFYPDIDKKDLFDLGYIATKSGHSRGGTVDLTLIDANTGEELNMGGSYDFFGEISHYDTSQITLAQKQNRELLKRTMSKHGFRPYPQEWWHYTLRMEPHPDTYFDFEVE
jgi:D-alanyl-D-alanine dipeptidase